MTMRMKNAAQRLVQSKKLENIPATKYKNVDVQILFSCYFGMMESNRRRIKMVDLIFK